MKKIWIFIVFLTKCTLSMELTPIDFLNNKVYSHNIKELLVSDLSFKIIPPLHLVRDNPKLVVSYDYSNVDFSCYPKLESLVFFNHFVDALPNNLFLSSNLIEIELGFGPNVSIEKEIIKLKKIQCLKFLDISMSIMTEEEMEIVRRELIGIEVVF